ncbi:MAG: hypothetical protein ACP5U1_10435 [Desulfomonilaceae bacterium]
MGKGKAYHSPPALGSVAAELEAPNLILSSNKKALTPERSEGLT